MEGAHPEFRGRLLAYDFAYALAHLGGRLVGEGQGHDARRVDAVAQKVHYLVCQHARLARAGTGDYELGASEVFDGGTLRFVELVKIIVHCLIVHRNWLISFM